MKKPLEKLTAQERRLTGRLDIKRGRLPEEIEAYFALPKKHDGRRFPDGWYPNGSKKGQLRWSKQRAFPLEKVPPERRPIAERKFHEIMARKQARGIKITHQHVGSAWGNAVFYANHCVTGNVTHWYNRHDFRRRLYFHLLKVRKQAREQAELQEFREKPLAKRVKWGMA